MVSFSSTRSLIQNGQLPHLGCTCMLRVMPCTRPTAMAHVMGGKTCPVRRRARSGHASVESRACDGA
eukprot:14548105-Alexandrium_andersonii.AAC.1